MTIFRSILGAGMPFYATSAGLKAPVEHLRRTDFRACSTRGISANAIGPRPISSSVFCPAEAEEAVACDRTGATESAFRATGLTCTESITSCFHTMAIPNNNHPARRPAETGHSGTIYRKPFGVILVIGPFNAPILLLDPAIVAVAAGNPVVLKPANTTAITAKLFAELIPQYFDLRDVTVFTGGREEISALLDLTFDFIFFTGSSKFGKVVVRAAAEHLTPAILELGRQKPALVDARTDLDKVADYFA